MYFATIGTALEQEALIGQGYGCSRELRTHSRGSVEAERPAPSPSAEDVLKAALEGKCIVWAGGGAAAAPGGWLVAAITPEVLAPKKIDNNNGDAAHPEKHENGLPKVITSCTQWEESDAKVALGVVPARTLPQLWANTKTPTVAAVSDPTIFKAAEKMGGRDRINGAHLEAPARNVSGREKKVLCPGAVGSGPEDRLTRSTLGIQTGLDSDLHAALGGVNPSASRTQTDVESHRGAILGGSEGGGPLMVSGETLIEERHSEDRIPPPWTRRWAPGCDHHEDLPDVGRECSSAAGGGAAGQEVCLSLKRWFLNSFDMIFKGISRCISLSDN